MSEAAVQFARGGARRVRKARASWKRPGHVVTAERNTVLAGLRMVESQSVQMVEEVNVFNVDSVRNLDARRSKVENGGDARVHQVLGSPLRPLRRSSDDADFNIQVGHHVLEVAGAVHFKAVDNFAYFKGVAVKYAHNVEPARTKFTVVEDSLTKVAHANKGHAPFAVNSQRRRDSSDERFYMIANPANAKFAKVSQVFSNLRAVYAASVSKGI